METRKLGERGQVVIPESIREKLGLKKGAKLIFQVFGEKIIIQKAEALWKYLERVPSEPSLIREILKERKERARKEKWNI